MKAIRITQHGGPENLKWEDVVLPALRPDEVLIQHLAIGVNFIDIYHRKGLYPIALPSGLGVEAVGLVQQCGKDVQGFTPGDRVAYVMAPLGAYAEQSIVPQTQLFQVPADLSPELIAANLLKGLTTAYLLHKTVAVGPGMTVLVHAAAGGVGQILCQWASELGAKVIGSVGSAQKAEIAKQRGCSEVILYRQEDCATRVRELTNDVGVDVVYDSVGADTFEASLNSCRTRGLLVSFGNASGPVPPFSPLLLTQHGSLFVTRPTLAHYLQDPQEKAELFALLFEKLKQKSFASEIKCYPLAQAEEAHRDLESGQTTGSLVLIP
jgi:NADPH:quinone reductase